MAQFEKRMPVEQRFWAKVNRDTCVGAECGCHKGIGHCWPWTAGLTKRGYGKFKVWMSGRWTNEPAHRTAFRLTHGSIPHALLVCHACDYKPCCRGSHLWLGTVADNTKDAYNKGRLNMDALWAKGCTPEVWGQISGERSPHAKLTEVQVREIMSLTGTDSCENIAERFGVSAATVSNIQNRKVWKSLIETGPLPPKRNRGHPRKLTDAKALEIASLKGVMTCKALSEQYGLSASIICNIQNGKSWKHLHT